MDGVKQKDLVIAVSPQWKADDLARVLSKMQSLGMVESRKVMLERGRPLTLWRAKTALIEPGATEKILEMME